MSDLAVQLARETTASYEQAQALIGEATSLGLDPEWIVRHSPDDPLAMLMLCCAGALRAAALEAIETMHLCSWRTCTVYVADGEITGGMGDPLCGCDNLPGWKSPYPAGTPKPQAPVKARGRHGSRVQRSARRRIEWRRMVAKYGTITEPKEGQ